MDLNIIIHRDKRRDAKDVILSKLKKAHERKLDGWWLQLDVLILSNLCLFLLLVGYKHVALSVYITSDELNKIPEPPKIEVTRAENVNLKIFTRLTIQLEDTSNNVHKVKQSPIIKQYDILAIEPQTEKLLNNICAGTFECDIVCFNMSERLPISIRKIKPASIINAGICFEINYSQALGSSIERQNVIQNGQLLVEKTRRKVSSWLRLVFYHNS